MVGCKGVDLESNTQCTLMHPEDSLRIIQTPVVELPLMQSSVALITNRTAKAEHYLFEATESPSSGWIRELVKPAFHVYCQDGRRLRYRHVNFLIYGVGLKHSASSTRVMRGREMIDITIL